MCRHTRALKFHVLAQMAIWARICNLSVLVCLHICTGLPLMRAEVQFMTAAKALASLHICIRSLEHSSLNNAPMSLDNTISTKISFAGSWVPHMRTAKALASLHSLISLISLSRRIAGSECAGESAHLQRMNLRNRIFTSIKCMRKMRQKMYKPERSTIRHWNSHS